MRLGYAVRSLSRGFGLRKVAEVVRTWRWRASGSLAPPPHRVKVSAVKGYLRNGRPRVFIETGTYMGDMVAAVLHDFGRIVTIELDPRLAAKATRRFRTRPHVKVLCGDSDRLMTEVLGPLDEPALFWLDAHYSSGITSGDPEAQPVIGELERVLGHPVPEHVVLIDDAREFDGSGGYPTLDEIAALTSRLRPTWMMRVEHDIIRLHAASSD